MAANDITVVGNTSWRFNAEHDWVDAFRSLGLKTVFVDELADERSIVGAAADTRVLLWIGSRGRHDQDVMRRCGEHCVTVAWHADLFWGLERDGRWQQSAMWAAKHVFTADGGHDDLWQAMGVNHKWLLPGIREKWVDFRGRKRVERFMCDVAFVGSDGSRYHREWPYRAELLAVLRLMCEKNGWLFRNPGGSQNQINRNGRMSDFYACAKVTVGDSLCLDYAGSRYWSDRVYEATGRGGVLIMPQIDELEKQTGGWLPMYQWSDWWELETMVAGLLEDLGRQAELRSLGREWAATQTYRHRAIGMLQELGMPELAERYKEQQ